MSVTALVGAQYGSEGKGAIAATLAEKFDIHVRTGGPNAGHTYYIDAPKFATTGTGPGPESPMERTKVVARQVPVGAKDPRAFLYIGPGGMLDIDLLLQEVQDLEAVGINVRNRLSVDSRAIVIHPVRHHQEEGGIHGSAHEKIGSTGEGVGLARMAHLNRGSLVSPDIAWAKAEHASDYEERLNEAGIQVYHTTRILYEAIDAGADVLLEGTQGSGLSSVTGPWPYCTSADTNAGQLCVDAGISPRWLRDVILVARTFPIRVAGTSGPLEDEITWEDLGVEPETTTVTKKVRRVGRWDDVQFMKAIQLNGPEPSVFFTFLDYVDPRVAGVTSWEDLTQNAIDWLNERTHHHDVQVAGVGTGPDSVAQSPFSKWR
jgi:adenylosuccinate synthase